MAPLPIASRGFQLLLPFRTAYSFWLVRAALLRGLGLIYAVAFLIGVYLAPISLAELGDDAN